VLRQFRGTWHPVSLEVFGHWRNAVRDPELFFHATMRDAARMIGLAP
jgi:hypothetical protein